MGISICTSHGKLGPICCFLLCSHSTSFVQAQNSPPLTIHFSLFLLYNCIQFPDPQGEATFVLASCNLQGVGGVTRNLNMAKQLFLYLNERKGLPEWVAGKGRVKLTRALVSIDTIAARLIQQVWAKRMRRKESERFFLVLGDDFHRKNSLNSDVLRIIFLFVVGGRFETGLHVFDEEKI